MFLEKSRRVRHSVMTIWAQLQNDSAVFLGWLLNYLPDSLESEKYWWLVASSERYIDEYNMMSLRLSRCSCNYSLGKRNAKVNICRYIGIKYHFRREYLDPMSVCRHTKMWNTNWSTYWLRYWAVDMLNCKIIKLIIQKW